MAAPRFSIAATRSYAEPAKAPASSQNTKPPVPLYGLDGTYASALVGQWHEPMFNQYYG